MKTLILSKPCAVVQSCGAQLYNLLWACLLSPDLVRKYNSEVKDVLWLYVISFLEGRNRYSVNKICHHPFLEIDSFDYKNVFATQSTYRRTELCRTIAEQAESAFLTSRPSTRDRFQSQKVSVIIWLRSRQKVRLLFCNWNTASSGYYVRTWKCNFWKRCKSIMKRPGSSFALWLK